MKKLLTITCLLVMNLVTANASFFCAYISDSGHTFYFSVYEYEGYHPTWDEADFLNSQGFKIIVETKSKNYDKLAMRERAMGILEDSLIAVYKSNKDYMWEHFPDYKYTLDEFLNIIKDFTSTAIYIDFFDIPCCVESDFDLRNILQSKTLRAKIEQYPYIMGYLYKEVKFHNGKRCKLQEVDVDYILFQNMPGQIFDVKAQKMIHAKK